jgi:hypothetical protein
MTSISVVELFVFFGRELFVIYNSEHMYKKRGGGRLFLIVVFCPIISSVILIVFVSLDKKRFWA